MNSFPIVFKYFLNRFEYKYIFACVLTLLCIYIITIQLPIYIYIYDKILVIILLYLVLNLWFFFQSMYSNNMVYTSVIQRFWKRTFMLFWILEAFLFLIFIYLIIIAPSEPKLFYQVNTNNNFNFYKNSNEYFYIFKYVTITFALYLSILYKKFNKYILYFIIPSMAILLIYVLIIEFRYMYFSIQYMKHFNYFYEHTNQNSITNLYHLDSFTKKIYYTQSPTHAINNQVYFKTITYYFLLLNIIKFWHIIIILLYNLLLSVKLINTGRLSYDLLSSNFQNSIYLLYFFLIKYVFTFISINYQILTKTYYWFFLHTNYTETFIYTILELRGTYLMTCANNINFK